MNHKFVFPFFRKTNHKTANENTAFLMAVDDVFSLKQGLRGVVVTGKIERGTISSKDTVQIIDSHHKEKSTVILAIETYKDHQPIKLDTASVGDTVGLLLKDLTSADVKKGYTIVKP